MNAYSTMKKRVRKTTSGAWLLRGVGTFTFDQHMSNHHVLSDREALAHDREALKQDVAKVWKTSTRELNPI